VRRKTFDMLATAGGAMLTIVLIAAGSLGLWGYLYTTSNVHDQLAPQQIFFPTQAQINAAKAGTEVTPEMVPYLEPYAGQQVLTGAQAQTYANHFIANHLYAMPYHGVYSQVSAASRADPGNAQLKALVQTSFTGTTLRGLLLEAYAFSVFGTIALVAAIVSFVLAGIMLMLTLLGVWHAVRTPEEKELPTSLHREVRVPATV
jgi:hypothetical protein